MAAQYEDTNAAVASGPEPLPVPFIPHEHLRAVKILCSTHDGLRKAKKNTIHKAIQELKKARVHLDEQMNHLELQLLNVTDFLHGASTKLLIAPPIAKTFEKKTTHAHINQRKQHAIAAPPPAVSMDPQAVLDLPCTSVGLWNYLEELEYFKTGIEIGKQFDSEDMPALPMDTTSDTHEAALSQDETDQLLATRLAAAILPIPPVDTPSTKDEQQDASDFQDPPSILSKLASWNPHGTMQVLQQNEVLPANEDAMIRQCLSNPQDDALGLEIRRLHVALCDQIAQNNVIKRALCEKLQALKPWITQEKEHQEIQEAYRDYARKREEAQRKKKHREKKVSRQQALQESVASSPLTG